ncbi:MAG: PD40 domain-containing protein [Deferribacteres bacterium]|nr:PD40 domain-containing protein [Deferribacteres bacterium]
MFKLFFSFAILMMLSFTQLFAQDYPILFTKQINNNDNLYLYTQQNGLRQITDHGRKDSSPVLSPDGRFIAFASERVGWWKIWLMDLGNGAFRQLTNAGNADYAPCWSPDGGKIAFVSGRDGNAEIYTMNQDGSNPINLSQSPGQDTQPFWGEDHKIYYSSQVKGVYQLLSMDADGANKTVITQGLDNKFMPQVSPDGKSILFYSEIKENDEIFKIAIDGSGRQRLTENPLQDMRARWAPDGKTIVFERGDKRRNHHIWVMNQDGSNQRQITFSDYNYSPSFVKNCHHLCADK